MKQDLSTSKHSISLYPKKHQPFLIFDIITIKTYLLSRSNSSMYVFQKTVKAHNNELVVITRHLKIQFVITKNVFL